MLGGQAAAGAIHAIGSGLISGIEALVHTEA